METPARFRILRVTLTGVREKLGRLCRQDGRRVGRFSRRTTLTDGCATGAGLPGRCLWGSAYPWSRWTAMRGGPCRRPGGTSLL
jgi:hypothetical protein